MKIDINVMTDEEFSEAPEPLKKHISSNIRIRRTISGDYQILDHGDMDIVVKPAQSKIVTFAKSDPDSQLAVMDADLTYEAQKRLFNFLTKKGVIDHDAVEGGSYYTSMEAKYLQPKEEALNAVHVVLFTISKFVEQEKPYYMFRQAHAEEQLDHFYEPDDEDSTDLGDVPQQVKKGSIDTGYFPSGANYRVYESLVKKGEK